MLSLKGDLYKETKGTPKSFERSLDEDTAILKNYEFEEYWELSICQVAKLQWLFDEDESNLVPRAFSSTIFKMVARREKALAKAELRVLLIGPFMRTSSLA